MKISGIVKKHTGRGRRLGFPTANVEAPENVEEGIYVGYIQIDPSTSSGQRLSSLVFIGASKTFREEEKHCEVYILDFKADLYGKEIAVELLEKIRDNKKFDSEGQLIAQMKEDERVAREFFKSPSRT